MEMVFINGKMAPNTRAPTSTGKNKDMEYFGTHPEKSMSECGLMASNKVMGRLLPHLERFRRKEYGTMESFRKLNNNFNQKIKQL